jgi:Icc-related predicted phosphoesterase
MIRIVAIGDLHENIDALPLLLPRARDADVLVMTGDFSNSGGVPVARRLLEKLRRVNPRCLAQVGNMDLIAIDRYLSDEGVNLHRRGHRIGDVGLFGVGGSNPTPFGTPTEFTEEEIARFLEEGHASVADAPVRIAVPHMPPHGSAVDRLKNGAHVGSRSVREFLAARRPQVCITGHIHEAVGSDRVESTLVLNPGPFSEARFVEVRVDGTSIEAEIVRLA